MTVLLVSCNNNALVLHILTWEFTLTHAYILRNKFLRNAFSGKSFIELSGIYFQLNMHMIELSSNL